MVAFAETWNPSQALPTAVPCPHSPTFTRAHGLAHSLLLRRNGYGGQETRGPARESRVSGLRFYQPDTGNWVNRDPIGEIGWGTVSRVHMSLNPSKAAERMREGNVYAFGRNSPISSIDLLGLAVCENTRCCSCGPEIKESLVNTLIAARQRFNNQSWWGQLQSCNVLVWPLKWDIYFDNIPLFLDCGSCVQTYMVGGTCYDRWEINYLLFGVMNRLCGQTAATMNQYITAWKMFGVPIRDMCSGQRPRNQLTPTLFAWARIGYEEFDPTPIFRDYLRDLPAETRFEGCKDCNQKWTNALQTEWPY